MPGNLETRRVEFRRIGNITKSVDGRDRRQRLYALQEIARQLLPGERVGACCRHLAFDRTRAEVVRHADGRAGFRGLVRCGSVWVCAKCADRITAGRRAEIQVAIKAARARGLEVLLLTLTARHHRGDDLAW